MFVSVMIDPGSVDSARSLVNVLTHSGFRKIQRSCWENMNFSEAELSELKKNIDRVTDYYDNVRIYQFPIDGMFVVTELKEKKWKRCQMKAQPVVKATNSSVSPHRVTRKTVVRKVPSKPAPN